MKLCWALATGTMLIVSAQALAQNYDFQDESLSLNYTNAPNVGPGVYPTTGAWSGYEENGAATNNGVKLTLSGFEEVFFPAFIEDGPNPFNGTPAFTLSQSLPTKGMGEFQLTGIPALPAGESYSLYLYGTNIFANDASTFSITSGGGIASDDITSTLNSTILGKPNDSFAEGVNYVLFNDLLPVDGEIDGLVTPTFPGGTADLNGLQLVADPPAPPPTFVPEPASVGLVLIATSVFLYRRPRRP
jgi:hypothetical protein